jgi:hypothetical protein
MRVAKRDALHPDDDPRTWTQRLPEAIDAVMHQNGRGIRATRKNWSLPAWYLPALWPQGTAVGPEQVDRQHLLCGNHYELLMGCLSCTYGLAFTLKLIAAKNDLSLRATSQERRGPYL